jgi:hypothetical protein
MIILEQSAQAFAAENLSGLLLRIKSSGQPTSGRFLPRPWLGTAIRLKWPACHLGGSMV